MTTYTISQFLTLLEKSSVVETAVSVVENQGFWSKVAASIGESTFGECIKTIAEFCDYIIHPAKTFLLFWNWTYELSYLICLLVALFGFFMVLLGNKKFKKYISGSIVSYFFINILNMFITQ